MLNGLDLFSGIGGIAISLAPWTRPVAYCENDPYAQAVLLSRMAGGQLPVAPIWDDVCTLRGADLPEVDIISGGFPCQDISVAGNGAGLAGERSGLFFEISRLAGELRPAFIFLENVPAITTRGGREVVGTLTSLGYDCRWCVISAASVGANHKRERWFLLAYANRQQHKSSAQKKWGEATANLLADSKSNTSGKLPIRKSAANTGPFSPSWWAVEPSVDRMAYGIPNGVDRIKGLGNAVVPLQARTAFEILSGVRS